MGLTHWEWMGEWICCCLAGWLTFSQHLYQWRKSKYLLCFQWKVFYPFYGFYTYVTGLYTAPLIWNGFSLVQLNHFAEARAYSWHTVTRINGLISIIRDVKLYIYEDQRWKAKGEGEPVRSRSSQTPSLLVDIGRKNPYTQMLKSWTLSPPPFSQTLYH